jgi:hypothetical protein
MCEKSSHRSVSKNVDYHVFQPCAQQPYHTGFALYMMTHACAACIIALVVFELVQSKAWVDSCSTHINVSKT